MKRCAVQGKKKFRSSVDAHIYAGLRKPREAVWGKMRAYLCPSCGFWHLTRDRRST